MKLLNFEHMVLPTRHLDECLHFYKEILRLPLSLEEGRYVFFSHTLRIEILNLADTSFSLLSCPVSHRINLRIVVDKPIDTVIKRLKERGAAPVSPVIQRIGIRGPMKSVYLEDPDKNLVEIAYFPYAGRKTPFFRETTEEDWIYE